MMLLLVWLILEASLVNCDGLSDKSTVIAVLGRDNASIPGCVSGSDYQCRLEELPQYLTNYSEVRLCSYEIQLKTVVTISKVSNVRVIGYDDAVVKCCSCTAAGLSFIGVDNLTLAHFKVNGCGHWIKWMWRYGNSNRTA